MFCKCSLLEIANLALPELGCETSSPALIFFVFLAQFKLNRCCVFRLFSALIWTSCYSEFLISLFAVFFCALHVMFAINIHY